MGPRLRGGDELERCAQAERQPNPPTPAQPELVEGHALPYPHRMLSLDIDIEAPWPADQDWADLAEAAVEAVCAVAPELGNPRLTASVLFTSDAEVHVLNREWRAKDKPTNVLSFPMIAREDLLALPHDGAPELLGDLALACETCTREADEKGLSLADHAAHLLVHGLLHLAGFDHETSPEDAAAMERLEIKALAKIGIADPYGDHGA